MTKVFVYGSLMRGLHNSHLLATSKLVNQRARTQATDFCLVACELEKGHPDEHLSAYGHPSAHYLYPYAIPHERARAGDVRTALRGETYEVQDDVLKLLDELEEHPDYYRREMIPLQDEADAWIYLLHDEDQLAAIRHDAARATFRAVAPPGDWRSFMILSAPWAVASDLERFEERNVGKDAGQQ